MKKNLLIAFSIAIFPLFAQEGNEKATDTLGTYQNLEEVVVSSGVIDVAKERKTPIAVSKITPAICNSKL